MGMDGDANSIEKQIRQEHSKWATAIDACRRAADESTFPDHRFLGSVARLYVDPKPPNFSPLVNWGLLEVVDRSRKNTTYRFVTGATAATNQTIAPAGVAIGIAAGLHPSVIAHAVRDDGTELTEIGTVGARSSATTRGEQGTQRYEGKAKQNEEGSLDVCALLRDTLNAQGGSWSEFKENKGRGRQVNDEDAVSMNEAGERLGVQVTRVAEEAVWKELGRSGASDREQPPAALAEEIKSAVERKKDVDRRLILALDARFSPGHAHATVVQEFRRLHTEWVRALGFRGVWLVGPTLAHVYRLD